MKTATGARRFACILGAGVFAVGLSGNCGRRLAPPVPPEHRRGAELAAQWCGSCHLVPTPDLLHKRAYVDVLNVMGLYLGHDDAGHLPVLFGSPTKAMRDLRVRVNVAQVLRKPALPPDDWKALRAYYEALAPPDPLYARPAAPVAEPEQEPVTHTFRAIFPEAGLESTIITALTIDAKRRSILAADVSGGRLLVLDAGGRTRLSRTLGGVPVALRPLPQGLAVLDAGNLFPTTERIGRAFVLTPPPWPANGALVWSVPGLYRSAHLAFRNSRNTDELSAIISGFGHHDGELLLVSGAPGKPVARRNLKSGAGFLRAAFVDFDRDGRMDALALQAQARERLLLLRDVDSAQPREQVLVSEHPAYGFTGFTLADFDDDGFTDVITTNGDNGDLASQPLRSFHGVRVYRNENGRGLKLRHFLPLDGAYDTRAADFDGDGDLDIAAISFYPDFGRLPLRTFVYFENRGGRFVPHSFPDAQNGRWLVMDAGDVDGDGDTDIVLGGAYTEQLGGYNIQRWKASPYFSLRRSLLLLENTTRNPARLP